MKKKKQQSKKQYEYSSALFKKFVTSNFGTKVFGKTKYSRKQKHKPDYCS